jgi:GTP cyclohydrolase II
MRARRRTASSPPGQVQANQDAARIRRQVEIPLPSGSASFISFEGLGEDREHVAIRYGAPGEAPLVRLHSECLTGDLFGSQRCDCGEQLREAQQRLAQEGGYLIYLRQEGRGIGLYPKLDAYALQDHGLDTFAANRALGWPEDARNFDAAARMLKALGVRRLRLLTNNQEKASALIAHGLEVLEVVPTGCFVSRHNRAYLEAKHAITNHTLDFGRPDPAPDR